MPEELPKGWVKTMLGEIRHDESEGISQEQMRGETFELYSVPAFSEGKPEVVPGDAIGSNKILVSPGDVLLCKINPRINRAWVVGEPHGHRQIASTEWIVFSKQEGISPEFLCYFFSQYEFRDYLAANVSGVGGSLMRVRPSVVGIYPFTLPPAAEQKRIVEKLNAALSGVERAETAARRAQERLHRYRAAVLHAAVTGELTRDWREAQRKKESGKPEIGDALLQRILAVRCSRWEEAELARLREKGKNPKGEHWKTLYKEPAAPDTANLPELPEEWTWASLDMIAEIGSGISVSQNRVVKNPVELPYLRVANVMRGYLNLTEVKSIRVEKERVEEYLLKVGDILFNEGGDRDKLGRGWVWEGQIPRCVHQNHVFRARLIDPSLLDARLVSHWGNTFGQHFFLSHGRQTTNLASINRSVLSKLPVPIPPIAEQSQIISEVERRLTAADRLATALNRQLEHARATRESLLREAFSGRLVPQNPNDQPASVLIKRIRAVREAEVKKLKGKRMPPTKSAKKAQTRRPLLSVLKENGGPMTPEELFQASGHAQESVDHFFAELRELTDSPAKVAEERNASGLTLLNVVL